MAHTLDCRHEVALKCPGGTKAISLGFQPEVFVGTNTMRPGGTPAMQALGAGFVHDFQCFTGLEGANDIRPAVAPSGQMFEWQLYS